MRDATDRRAKPPIEGVSPELLELVIRWLRKKYGDRPVRDSYLYRLTYHLGDLERDFNKDPQAAAVAKVRS